jgi:hypothetical protein
MPVKRRVFCSLQHPDRLDERRRRLQDKIVEHVVGLGLQPEIFLYAGTAAGLAWSLQNAIELMRQCVGAVVVAFPRWTVLEHDRQLHLPSEFAQIEGAIATTVGLPLLLVSEQGLADRGVIWTGAGNPILFMPSDAETSWFTGDAFLRRLRVWSDQIAERSDLFLGYSSKARSPAQAVHLFLKERLGLKVRNWEMDFAAGGVILDEIETAARLCTGGIFLFTKDDAFEGGENRAAPRDNVVFEAGYFAAAKGRERVLIIREEGAKMPADLGGSIYLPLADRNDIRPIESALRDFVDRRL